VLHKIGFIFILILILLLILFSNKNFNFVELNNLVLVGVLSGGLENCGSNPQRPDIYTSVNAFKDWIVKTLQT
jgi:hypothetical protein